ncbi:hypothetical protein [Agreia sp. COWG]|uniref:hypothetical protein n=1 Tax=Agreia sp. COWG TaxID=2773266 RepID=UPI00192942CC|nr:hypothetical protein [Agreia sp. COWG]CAD6005219.1 protein of unknown function [Agreia sp. COWG]
MCGACGTARGDWAQGLVGGSYAASVVARTLTSVLVSTTVKSTPAGLTLAARGRPAILHGGLDSVLASAAPLLPAGLSDARGDWERWARVLDALPEHRPVMLDRAAVPLRYRGDGISGASLAADPPVLGPPDPTRAINRVTLFALAQATGAPTAELSLRDTQGLWSLSLAPVTTR